MANKLKIMVAKTTTTTTATTTTTKNNNNNSNNDNDNNNSNNDNDNNNDNNNDNKNNRYILDILLHLRAYYHRSPPPTIFRSWSYRGDEKLVPFSHTIRSPAASQRSTRAKRHVLTGTECVSAG